MRLLFALIAVSALAQEGRDLRVESGPRRLALVVGINDYPKWPLRNAANDARAMAAVLKEIGFRTEVSLNAGLRSLEQQIDAFIGSLRPGDVALFYYAGHGIQLEGENYLVPVDFNAKDEADAKYDSYSASRVQERMDNSGARLNILILDACRNNPFRTTRSSSGGLAPMNSGRGTLIAFATSPGKTADDNASSNNGLFTSHLISALRQPGLSIDQVFNRVREKVYSDSSERQLPWTVSSIIGEFYFQPGTAASAKPRNPLARPLHAVEPAGIQTAAPPAPVAAPTPVTAAAANEAFQRGDYQEAIRRSMEVLRSSPGDKDALFVATASRYRSHEYQLFETTALQAIAAGASIPLLLGHHHTLTGAHAAALKLGAAAIGFETLDPAATCNQKPFELPPSSIVEAKVISTNEGEVFLNLRVRDAQNKVRNFNFAHGDSRVETSTSTGLPRVIPPPEAQQALQAIANVIRQMNR